MRFTIERIRMLVVAAAVVLVVALVFLLVAAKWRSKLSRRDLPQRLAKEIQQEANGFSFVHAYGAHLQYKIHASKEVQLRDNRVLLHDVQIELYGEDGSRIDQIDGDEFEYDQKSGLAIAVGPVEMVLTQPTNASPKNVKGAASVAISPAAPRQIHVKTSGVTFDRDSGMVTTMQRVDFDMTQGSGTSTGATYDSQNGHLTLDHAVELTTQRNGGAVRILAQHAEFDRGAGTCWLRAATADYRGAQADAAQATILFRPDGSAATLDATGGFTLATQTGGHLAAPTATMDFDEHSQPRHGRLEGGVTMDSVKGGRTVHGTSPAALLEFASQGQLRHAHFERGVTFASVEKSPETTGQSAPLLANRTWHSPDADVDFRSVSKGQIEPADVHGTGGVVITSETRDGGAVAASATMTADEVTGAFGPNSVLSSMTGSGHASIVQKTATGVLQTATGDRLEASFAEEREQESKGAREQAAPASKDRLPRTPVVSEGASHLREQGAGELESAELDGHVKLFQQPVTKPGGQPQPPLRATAGKAVYEGAGEWLHLTESPRVDDGGLQLTANKVDVSQQSGDAFAHGNVKATWTGGAAPGRQTTAASGDASHGGVALGGNEPAHLIAAEAQLNESTGEATFRGHARLWQQANSVSGPEIVLNQHLQTLVARTTESGEPVRAVLLSASGPMMGMVPGQASDQNGGGSGISKSATPSVIRVRGGDLWYSDAEHRAVMHGGVVGTVVAETGAATSASNDLELRIMPAGPRGGGAQVDRMTATGSVVLTSQGRRGTGEQLVYSSVTGEYVLTGTDAAPPRMTDPEQGNVTGNTLIFHSRDDSVSIEGGGRETITQTTAPAHGK